MEIVKVERNAFLMDATEIDKMIQVYQYARHRVACHTNCGLKSDVRYIDYVLAKLKEAV